MTPLKADVQFLAALPQARPFFLGGSSAGMPSLRYDGAASFEARLRFSRGGGGTYGLRGMMWRCAAEMMWRCAAVLDL